MYSGIKNSESRISHNNQLKWKSNSSNKYLLCFHHRSKEQQAFLRSLRKLLNFCKCDLLLKAAQHC